MVRSSHVFDIGLLCTPQILRPLHPFLLPRVRRVVPLFPEAPAPVVAQNVGLSERVASVGGGAALLAAGILRGRGLGLLLGLEGAALVYRGVRGYCSMYQSLGISTARQPEQTAVPALQGVKIEKEITVERMPRGYMLSGVTFKISRSFFSIYNASKIWEVVAHAGLRRLRLEWTSNGKRRSSMSAIQN